MKIAAITLTRNDDFRLVPWKMYFQDYKDELYEHIVVDNGSTPEYQRKLREAFPRFDAYRTRIQWRVYWSIQCRYPSCSSRF